MSDSVLIVAICVTGLVSIVAIVHNLVIHVRANRDGAEIQTRNRSQPRPANPKPPRKRP